MTSSESPRPRPPRIAQALTATSFLILYLPLITMVIYSFLSTGIDSGQATLQWYRNIFSNPDLMGSVFLSLWVALISSIGATLLGTLAALAIVRKNFVGKEFFNLLTLIPLVIPELVMGISFLIWFVILQISLGTLSMILAHITFSISYVIVTVVARLNDFDVSIEEAARDLGATSWQVFWKVTFPLVFPGILSGGLMAFTLSFDDFLVSFFTAGVGSDTLPVKIYSMTKYGMAPEINALSTLILLATFVLVFILFRPGGAKLPFTQKA